MFSFKELLDEAKRTGCTCWTGYKRVPGTEPCESGSCIKESTRGLWDNIHAKRERIKAGSGEKMRKPGSKGAPTAAAFKASQNEEVELGEAIDPEHPVAKEYKALKQHDIKTLRTMIKGQQKIVDTSEYRTKDHAISAYLRHKHGDKKVATAMGLSEELEAQFDLIESVVEELAMLHNLDSDYVWEKFEQFSDEELLEYAVDAKGHKSSTGGLTQKGRDAYNAKGANLQAPVTTPPSKLSPDSKAAKRRKSFCARMGGMEGPMKKPNGEPTRKALALRKWNC